MLYLNYAFSNNEYDGITGEDILEFVIGQSKYSNIEKLEIIDDAMQILKIKYNKKLLNDKNDQFLNLKFD